MLEEELDTVGPDRDCLTSTMLVIGLCDRGVVGRASNERDGGQEGHCNRDLAANARPLA